MTAVMAFSVGFILLGGAVTNLSRSGPALELGRMIVKVAAVCLVVAAVGVL